MYVEVRDAGGNVLGMVVLDESGKADLAPGSQLDAEKLWVNVPAHVQREDGERYLLALRDAYLNLSLHAVLRYGRMKSE